MNTKEISYIKSDGKKKRAPIVKVSFSLEGLSNEEVQVAGYLSEASDGTTPISAQQQYGRMLEMYFTLLDLESHVSPKQRKELEAYNTLLMTRNSLWAADGSGFRFPLARQDIPRNHPIREFSELLIYGTQAPQGKDLYPVGITEGEIQSLNDPLRVNSTIVMTPKGLRSVINEKRFRKELRPVIANLKKARDVSTNETLKNYIDAKITELKTGSLESREASSLAWLKLKSPVDFVIGTAIEQYLDELKGVRGNAQSTVFRINDKYQGFSDSFIDFIPELEERAPWNVKRKINKETMPILRFADVATWAGGYEHFPMTTLAESLPNEEDFRQKYGSVNMIFANIQEALGAGEDLIKEFLPREAVKYKDAMPYMRLLMTSAHELGHASGGVIEGLDPDSHFGKEYSRMEEARAELFSMWVLPYLRDKGIISADQEMAGYYAMTTTVLTALKRVPNHHSGSRNMMFHYFMEKGALVEREEDGKLKYFVNPEAMRNASRDMLGELGNIRGGGNKDALAKFKSKYLSEARKPEFEKRMESMPEGRLLIFPTMTKEKGRYTGELVYPSSFRGQTRTLNNFVY